MNLNKTFVLGNVTRDPEVRALPSGQQVTSFGVATNRFYTDSLGQKKQDVEFHNIVAFGKLADISSRYLKKGSLVLIEGRLKTRNWQDSAGVKHWKTEIIAEVLQLGPKMTGSSGNYNASSSEKSFSNQNQTEIKQEEIPIIEENYTPPAGNNDANFPPINPEEQKAVSFEENAADEIDVRDIPF
ncbi:MAG: single-stranded DNA-binding protein [Patescibacteria group bacterium]